MVKRVKLVLEALILSYAQVLFSPKKLLGLFLIAGTFISPLHGLCGLLGGGLANIAALFMGLPKENIRKGLYGFNGVLVGLGLGLFYKLNLQLITLLVLSSILLAFITLFFQNTITLNTGIPSLSMPFNIVTWLILSASLHIGLISPANEQTTILNLPQEVISPQLELFFSTIGAIFFQPNPLSGMIITLGVLLTSRVSLILLIIGFITADSLHQFLGIASTSINMIGFNYMLTSLAIGGIFLVPRLSSLILGAIGAAIAGIFFLGLKGLFPDPLSPLALPFNLTVMLTVYYLRLYPNFAPGIYYLTIPGSTPEENLKTFQEKLQLQKESAPSVSLPIHGQWKVTQGINGRHTHKEDWRFAYDFQAVDCSGKIYKNGGTNLTDYYSYALPVIAPANGIVREVRNEIEDNQPGKINTAQNWGNYVIIEHAPLFFSCIAHLQCRSIRVSPGQEVKKGEFIGACGNSGRSPYPHLHLQFQKNPNIGAPSITFDFSNIVIVNNENLFLPKGKLDENSIVKNFTYPVDSDQLFPYVVDREWVYTFKGHEERWHLECDFNGNFYIVSSPADTKLYFKIKEGVLTFIKLLGSKKSALSLLGTLFIAAPMAWEHGKLNWTSSKNLYSIPCFCVLKKTACNLSGTVSELTFIIQPSLYFSHPFGAAELNKQPATSVTLKKGIGVEKITIDNKEILSFLELSLPKQETIVISNP